MKKYTQSGGPLDSHVKRTKKLFQLVDKEWSIGVEILDRLMIK